MNTKPNSKFAFSFLFVAALLLGLASTASAQLLPAPGPQPISSTCKVKTHCNGAVANWAVKVDTCYSIYLSLPTQQCDVMDDGHLCLDNCRPIGCVLPF